MSTRAHTRQLSIELLRIAAICGIAIFHTFQPWFEARMSSGGTPVEMPFAALGDLGVGPLTILACIDQLGAWGNHVFVMISGFFLLPRCASMPWHTQIQRTGRRVLALVSVIVPYIVCALLVAVQAPTVTAARLDTTTWLFHGLQFIWVYLALIILCPFLGWLWWRCPHQTVCLGIVLVGVYTVNAYIAFISPGDPVRTLFEWRKLMSALTYGASFIAGGWLATRIHAGRSNAGVPLLITLVILTVVSEYACAVYGNTELMRALSYKSTSLFAFVLALAALVVAASGSLESAQRHPALAAAVAVGTSGTLGFYVLQSLFSRGWHHLADALLAQVAPPGFGVFLLVGVGISLALLVALIAPDTGVRRLLSWSTGLCRMGSHR